MFATQLTASGFPDSMVGFIFDFDHNTYNLFFEAVDEAAKRMVLPVRPKADHTAEFQRFITVIISTKNDLNSILHVHCFILPPSTSALL